MTTAVKANIPSARSGLHSELAWYQQASALSAAESDAHFGNTRPLLDNFNQPAPDSA